MSELGYDVTLGSIIAKHEKGVSSTNWMKEKKFGGVDRKLQICNTLERGLNKILYVL